MLSGVADPERVLADGTPCWCPDPDIPSHTPRCITLRSFAGVKGNILPAATEAARLANQAHAGAHTRELQDAFIIAYAEWGIIRAACEAVGINRSTVSDWRKTDSAFVERMAVAKESATELLEMEAERRARLGWDEPVFQQGQQIGTVKKFSDTLLLARLKAEKPSMYRDTIRDAGSSADAPQLPALPVMDDHERSALRQVLEEAIAAQVASEPKAEAEPRAAETTT